MGEVVELVRQNVNDDVVKLLRDTLSMAERGEILAVCVVSQMSEACTGTGYALGDGDMAHLITALERVKLRLLQL